jgi:hypothetical protein
VCREEVCRAAHGVAAGAAGAAALRSVRSTWRVS